MSRGTVLVTGASAGIGEALAREFYQHGFDLVLTARRASRLERLQSELQSAAPGQGQTVTVISADLADPKGVDALIAATSEQSLAIDILVNNAGTMPDVTFRELTETDIEQTLSLNVAALTRLSRHYVTDMVARGSGRILNVASVAAFHPVPGMDLYAATKAFVLSLSESLSENLRGTGVSVTALCPGLTKTEMVDESIAKNMPPFMMSTPEEVAREGVNALMAREAICIPGMGNKAALTWAQFQPRWLIRGLGGLAARFTG